MSYWRFAAMIATSTVVMFGLMYLNTYALEHVFWSQTRAWMAVVMGATMAVIMLGFMLAMYKRRGLNIAIFAGAIAAFAAALWLVRSQATVDDDSYMMAMIPHHSIAIMTSNRANISDPRVRKLADEIIEAQNREIAEMRYLIEQAAATGEVALGGAPDIAPLATASEALTGAHIPTLDPAPLNGAEIADAIGDVPRCDFRYTRDGAPVVAFENASDRTGVVELNGKRIELSVIRDGDGIQLVADPIRLIMNAAPGFTLDGMPHEVTEAELIFEIGDELRVGYVGYLSCR